MKGLTTNYCSSTSNKSLWLRQFNKTLSVQDLSDTCSKPVETLKHILVILTISFYTFK